MKEENKCNPQDAYMDITSEEGFMGSEFNGAASNEENWGVNP